MKASKRFLKNQKEPSIELDRIVASNHYFGKGVERTPAVTITMFQKSWDCEMFQATMNPEQARKLAAMLLAAADVTERELSYM